MLTRMQQRRGTQAEWNDSVIASTVILQAGELGLETDTGRFKIGNGTSVWQDLPYYLPDNNPSSTVARQGKNNQDIYSRLSPLAPTYTQNFTGAQVLVPQSGTQTPLVVSGVSGQSAVLQRWRDNTDATLASIDHTGKLTAAGGASFNAVVNMNSNKVTNVATPTSDNDAVNKIYVDDAIAGLAWKEAVQLIAHGPGSNVALTGATNTLNIDTYGALNSSDTGYRILLTGQTTATENGIYVYNDNGTTYTLTRSSDADSPAELIGASVYVQEGTLYGTSSWVQSNHYVDSYDDQLWVQFSGAALITAGTGMTKDGNKLDVVGTTDRITANADSIDIAATYAGQASITTLGTVTTGTWSADTIDETKGGTGQTSYAVGDILYADTTTSLNKLTAGTAGYPILSGGASTAPAYGQVNTTGIADDAVTYAKIQNVANQYRVLGRISAGSGNTEEVNPDQLMTIINQGNTDISFSLLPVGTTSTTVAQGDHTHTLDQLSDVVITGTPVLRQVLKYDGTKWINELPSGGISIGATPPSGASNGDAWFDSTDGSLYVYYDDGVGSSRTNLITNPNFETDVSGWTTDYGTVTRDTANKYSGLASALLTPVDPSESIYFYKTAATSGLVVGQTYSASVRVKGVAGKQVRFILGCGGSNKTTTFNATGGWDLVKVENVVCTINGNLSFAIWDDWGAGLNIDEAILETGTTVGEYFDGSSTGASWTGTPNASTSTTTSGSAQWVQVKANSALEGSILTRVSALEARATDVEAANAVRVLNQAERDSTYPAPVQGNTVFRADLDYEEKYYAAFSSTTNPDGTLGTPGWYEYRGSAPLSPNLVINGNFDIWQRGTSISVSSSALAYTADRWYCVADGTTTVSRVATGQLQGSTYSLRSTRSTATPGSHNLNQLIETLHVRSLMGKTVTFSINLRRSAGIANPVSLNIYKSSTVDAGNAASWSTVATTSVPISVIPTGTTSSDWYRASVTAFIPNDGTANTLMLSIGTFGINNNDYFEISQAQIEIGPVPTSFHRNQENIQAELAACQRYYVRFAGGNVFSAIPSTGNFISTTTYWGQIILPVPMRITPTSVEFSNIGAARIGLSTLALSSVTIGAQDSSPNAPVISGTVSGATAGQWASVGNANNAAGFLAFSAEL